MIETLLHFSVQGQRVTGTLCLPQGGPAPVVLMVHGFTGSRDEMAVTGTGEGVFSRSARRMAQQGLASLRIDCRGSGTSEGDFANTTYEGRSPMRWPLCRRWRMMRACKAGVWLCWGGAKAAWSPLAWPHAANGPLGCSG